MSVVLEWIQFLAQTCWNSFMAPYGSPEQQIGAWDSISFVTICYFMVSVSVLFMELVIGFEAPYGKFHSKARQRVSYFPIFLQKMYAYPISPRFGWFVQELPSFAISFYFLYFSYFDEKIYNSKLPMINRILLGLFCLHYFNRTFIYSYQIRGGKPTAFFAFCVATMFTAMNGYLQSITLIMYYEYYIIFNVNASYFRIYFGIFLFLSGFIINYHSDYVLRNLRKPGEKVYRIPKNGMFNYVTSAHYFGENLEWVGFAIACNSGAGYSFAFFTFANLFPRALQNHKWYQTKFREDYPKNRKIFIPFVL